MHNHTGAQDAPKLICCGCEQQMDTPAALSRGDGLDGRAALCGACYQRGMASEVFQDEVNRCAHLGVTVPHMRRIFAQVGEALPTTVAGVHAMVERLMAMAGPA